MKTQILNLVKTSPCRPLTETQRKRYTIGLENAIHSLELGFDEESQAEKIVCEVALETGLDPNYCRREIYKIVGVQLSTLFVA